jgi:hypothetical protein
MRAGVFMPPNVTGTVGLGKEKMTEKKFFGSLAGATPPGAA